MTDHWRTARAVTVGALIFWLCQWWPEQAFLWLVFGFCTAIIANSL